MPGLRALLDAQRAAFANDRPRYQARMDALRSLERAIVDRRQEIIKAISSDFGGRAAEEIRALELFPLLNEIRHARRHLWRWMAPRRVLAEWQFWPARARILHEPLGVVGILSPWNYPLFLSLAPLAGALAAGNHALLKPSELAPASAELIRSIISAIYPPEYVDVVLGDARVGAEFAALPFDHLFFTGSTTVGREVMRAASENLVPVTLELGGKSPAIVHPDYPTGKAADRILAGKLYNAGQTCAAPDYALVHQDRRAEFVSAARRAIARMYPTLLNGRDYTRVINAAHYRRLTRLVDDARSLGAEVVTVTPGGDPCDESSRIFPPTLVSRVREPMAVLTDEIFGPVLPIVEYREIDEAIRFVNQRPHPLALYYFDEDGRRVDQLLRRVPAGGVTVNDCLFHLGQPRLPFGGIGQSGMGRYHGVDGFQTFSNRKAVLFQARWSPLALMRPPYTTRTRQILRFLLRS